MDRQRTITVLGAGYVGLPTAVLFALVGYKVFVVEPNPDRRLIIASGHSFFFEDGLDPLVEKAVNEGSLIVTDSYAESVSSSDIVFSCVGTPDNPDGSSNLSYVFRAANEALRLMPQQAIFVQKSTVPVGTGARIETLFLSSRPDLTYVSNPEFLRQGTALSDTLYPDRIVVGGGNTSSIRTVLDAHEKVQLHRDELAVLAGIASIDKLTKYFSTKLASAELIKVISNAFLALKISFTNEMAMLADASGADISEIMQVVGADKRIGPDFLNAGRGYGGGCFPKDVDGAIASFSQHGLVSRILPAAQQVNERMPNYIIEKIQEILKLGSLEGLRIAVLGLAFKAGTSDVRKSPGVKIANILAEHGALVTAYDPEAINEARGSLLRAVVLADSIESASQSVDVVVIATEWPEITAYDSKALAQQMEGTLFVDAVNMCNSSMVADAGLVYIGVGR